MPPKKATQQVSRRCLIKGADVNAKNNNGGTALIWASKKGHTGIVQLLKKAGAKE